MKKTPSYKISRFIGKGFAHIQDTFDQACVWGFKSLKKLDTKESPKTEHSFVRGLRKIGGVLGELGDSYFEEYENIKKRRKKD